MNVVNVQTDNAADPHVRLLRRCYEEYVEEIHYEYGIGKEMSYVEWLENWFSNDDIEGIAKGYWLTLKDVEE